jgi:hypothetical protein
MRQLLLITAALAAMAAPAAAAPTLGGGTTCVRHDDIYSWDAISDKQLIVENLRHQKVLLGLIGSCSGLKFRQTIVISSRGATGLDCIRKGDNVFVRDNGTGTRCSVISVAPYDGSMNNRYSHGSNADDHGGDHNDHGSY